MHLKRLNTPKRWDLSKKKTKFISRTSPGGYEKNMSIPLIVLLRDNLKLVSTKSQAQKLINEKKILVNCKLVKDLKLPIGLFDTISLPAANKYFRLVIANKGKFEIIKIDEKESKIKLLRIEGKKRVKKGQIQFNLTGGRNFLSKEKYSIMDSLLFDLEKNKVIKHLPLKEGVKVLVLKGTHAGEITILEGFKKFENVTKDRVILKNKDSTYQTMKDYVFVLGVGKEEIKIKE